MEWTIGELVEQAGAALTGEATRSSDAHATETPDARGPSGDGRGSGRVKDLPSERLVRWYVTIGLVDPPLARRGRTALYGPRHLLQLVAVKRRQAQGRKISDIQAELAGATDAVLQSVARVPRYDDPSPSAAPRAAPGRFWARPPAPPEAPAGPVFDFTDPVFEWGSDPAGAPDVGWHGPTHPVPFPEAAPGNAEPSAPATSAGPASAVPDFAWNQPGRAGPAASSESASATPDVTWSGPPRTVRVAPGATPETHDERLVQGIRLAPGVTLLLDGPGARLGPDETAALVSAARPLLDRLSRLGRLGHEPPTRHPTSQPHVAQNPEGNSS
ncbi:MerR family transcriptional regulator [Rhizohabitans arisaemae]|uniref:MerR family transcriptional regulator n=1 Tax=Rhizohabitans arisaemae TaxID=2720610 RepID=UPI0024B1FC05|nr:MerR family transcriptional regulator [Rhizohabitans arisaemae]